MIGISAKEAKENFNDKQIDAIEKFKDIADELITLIIRNASIDDDFINIYLSKFILDILKECIKQDIYIKTEDHDFLLNYLVVDMVVQLRNLGFKCVWRDTSIPNASLFISWRTK